MIQTYQATPEFGDGKKFQQELKVVTERLGRLETQLAGLNRELDLVESARCLHSRNSLISPPTDTGSETSDYTSSNSIDDNLESAGEEEEDWAGEFEVEVKHSPARKLLALYSYDGSEEGTIAIKLGEELDLLEEDVDGWSRVRRSGCVQEKEEEEEEGFIPTSFTSPITDS